MTKESTAAFSRAVPMMRRPGIVQELFGAVDQQFVLIGCNLVEPDVVDIVERCAQPDAARDIGRAGFELIRQLVVSGLFEGDRENHVAAALVGGHGIQQFRLSVEDSDAGRAQTLWPEKA